jgi:hypothetical protein
LTAGPDSELNFALVPYHPAEQAPGTTADQVRLLWWKALATRDTKTSWPDLRAQPQAACVRFIGNRR